MTSDPYARALRAGLDAWEQEAAAAWDRLVRSPETLQKVGLRLAETLHAQQRVMAALQAAALQAAAAQEQAARERVLLQRLEQRVESLRARLEALEAALDGERDG